MRSVVGILLAASLLVTGCSGPATNSEVAETAQTRVPEQEFTFQEIVEGRITYVEYKPGTRMAIVATPTVEPAPCVVILHGHNVETAYYDELAHALAGKGIAVFVPDWDDTLPSNEDSRKTTITKGLDDVADAMRFIRLHAERYGGDPTRIVIVGHSLGAATAMTTMLAGDRFGSNAFPGRVNALPDGYISLDGVVPFRELLWTEDLRQLYARDPATWDKINPETYLDEATVRGAAEFRFFVASLDFQQTDALAERLRTLGYKTRVETLDVGHMQAAEPQTETVDAIVQLAFPD